MEPKASVILFTVSYSILYLKICLNLVMQLFYFSITIESSDSKATRGVNVFKLDKHSNLQTYFCLVE